MASPRLELGEIQPLQQDAARPEPAFAEARHWIEQVTGRSFGDKDFRSGLENGILLCELLNAIKPGLVKKINRLSTPIAGLDNTILFLRGCKELGLKESQLFDPGDLQDTSNRITVKNIDNSRKLKNVLVTIYWLGKAANRCTSYSGATLNLKEFEGLLAQMRKETEDIESPKRNIRDSGYIDCWDSERSDSLSPPRHGRDDSFDSLDSFGSRSQQTPSPDVVLRGSSDGRGSDSESDLPHRKMPDVKKDDMSARRASYGEPKSVVPFNQYLPNKSNQTAYIPAPLRKKKAEREEYRKSWSTATSPLGGEKPFSKNHPETIEEEQNEAPRQHEEEQVGCMASRTNPSKSQVDLNQNKGKTIGQFPSGSAKETAVHKCKEKDAEEIRKLRRLEQAGIKVMPAAQRYGRFGPRTAVSDDAESVSMFDMRCEDEAVMQPHSKARHEKLQHIHNQLKEDEDRWQDDLARWKSRRRSASQDLIKKEAERKKMERLLSGGDGISERRKSIKTYREIVEEKERREKELYEAYKNARSHEEAESILQQYIERFTISEAVLERLEMPKILERSHSVEPNSSSPPKDPNPMRYLRQQSLPPPKYTATIEATIVPINESEATVSTGQISPSKTVVSKAVPMLTPKPYAQPKNTHQVLKTFKVDGKVSMNGETFNGLEEKDKECTTVIFAPLLRRSPKFEGVSGADGYPMELKQDTTSIELSLKRPATHTVHRELTASFTEEAKPANQKDETDSGRPEMMNSGFASPAAEQKQFKTTVTCARPAVPSVEFPPSTHSEEAASKDKDLKKPETQQQKEAEVLVTEKVVKSKAPEQEGSILFPSLKKVPEPSQVILQNSDQQADSDNSDKSNRFSFWSWDPEEERKRQERWQHEQERLLQERYQKEQDKLKEEWEKAQKEVEEEERRYYEEERKIIEDTVVPFTVSSSSAEPLSTSSSATEGNGTMNMMELSDSQEEEKQKEIKRQEKLPWEQEGASLAKNKKSEPCLEKKSSVNKVPTEHPETILQRESEQDHQVSVTEHSSPVILNLPLTQDVLWNQQLLTKQSPHISEEVRQKTSLDQSIGQQDNSPGERRRTGCHENFRPGLSSPCSPTPQNHSPNRYQRSVSGKKLCSTCRLPLGKGAAMIIETLGLYFHIHCFRCGICKGQLGDAASGTDVRIRNGLLNCNDCYIKSRTAGQPTTL
ncbi:LIM and calponin homology domains-containing protein 1 isoform X15 [Malaclemys terrapin pileata]|uniref:LIM and calponin homology domains-containing protein 1 isoform X15 n=1 Tax=Malaclemys terrapin pileata TaxID=2991368 RepID=UPI0023A895FB|nr:LIM and calponin homology domains-containing protein 1 isoform X15 [Malaclemys terrapin pileata]